jgi:hypothetical protein
MVYKEKGGISGFLIPGAGILTYRSSGAWLCESSGVNHNYILIPILQPGNYPLHFQFGFPELVFHHA